MPVIPLQRDFVIAFRYPLQFASLKMPEWISVWVAKIFGSEPVVKVMYVLIGWAFLILLIPAGFAASISEKSNIPFSGQLCLFAFAFVIVDATHRTISKFDQHRKKVSDIKDKNNQDKLEEMALIRDIENLDIMEKNFLKPFANSSSAWLPPDHVSVTSLTRKRLVTCTHHRRRIDGKLTMSYNINSKYAEVVRKYFIEKNEK